MSSFIEKYFMHIKHLIKMQPKSNIKAAISGH